MSLFQKVASATAVSLIVLIFVGAVVRATGSGMGCPDWPTCWGCWIPPTSKGQIDVDSLPIKKYKEKAKRHGRDPGEITRETVLEEFDPVETWIEYVNRLTSMPLGILTLITFIMAHQFWRKKPKVYWAAFIALVLLLVNAIMGRNIVYSGLKPGVITIHMALAILMLCVIVYIAWAGRDRPWRFHLSVKTGGGWTKKAAFLLFVLVLAEGVMGSQVREMTDELQKIHGNAERSSWVEELEGAWIYLVHRSFSWLLLLSALVYYFGARKRHDDKQAKRLEVVVVGTVISQMLLGFWISLVGLSPVIQVLHIGLSSILVACLFLWLLASSIKEIDQKS